MIEYGSGRRLQEQHLKDALSEVKLLRVRIAELEAALRVIKGLALTTHQTSKYRSDYLRIIDAALAGGKDE